MDTKDSVSRAATSESGDRHRPESQDTPAGADSISGSRPQSRGQSPSSTQSRKRDANAYKFEPTTKSWRGPVIASMVMMKHTKRIRSKLRQLDLQKKQEGALKVKKATEASEDAAGEVDPDEDEDEDGTKPDPDVILTELPIIMPPFRRRPANNSYTPWRAPSRLEADRNKNFDFERNPGNANNCSYNSPRQQLLRLSEDMAQTGAENEMLRKQLSKAQKENYDLIQELQGYKGKHYEDLVKENGELKVHVERVHRDNIRLHGDMRKDDNTVLRRLYAESQLAALRSKQFHTMHTTQLPAI